MSLIKLNDSNVKDFVSSSFKCYIVKDSFMMVSDVVEVDLDNQVILLDYGYLKYDEVSLKPCKTPKYITDNFSSCYRVYSQDGRHICWLANRNKI